MLSELTFTLGRDDEALPLLQEAAQLFGQLEDRDSEALMSRHIAVVYERNGRPEALAAWERARTLAVASGDPRGELDAVEGVARVTRSTLPAEAAARYEDALALAARLGDNARAAAIRNTLGILAWEAGAYAAALGHYEAALAIARELGDRVHEGLALNSIGVTLARLHRYEEARTALEDALAVNRSTGRRTLEGHTLAALGDISHDTRRPDQAVDYYDRSLAIRRELGDRRGEGWMLQRLARARAQSASPEAAELLARALEIAGQCGDDELRRACDGARGEILGSAAT
jgi:tetratricopeptide (TPR) repeat protein